MPATAGRVHMPANNCVHSSAALQTHRIWQSVIGYDPYAPENNNKHLQAHSSISVPDAADAAAANETTSASSMKNAYTSLQGLLDIARLTSNPDETRGACRKCGRVSHLTFQCRNFLSVKTIGKQDDDILQASNEAKFAQAKNKASNPDEEGSDKDDTDSDSTDSDIDPMLEKIIAERQRTKSSQRKQSEQTSRHRSSSTKDKKKDRRKKRESSDQDSESDSDRKRHRKDWKRQRTHRSKDDESGGEGRRHRHQQKKRHHSRNTLVENRALV